MLEETFQSESYPESMFRAHLRQKDSGGGSEATQVCPREGRAAPRAVQNAEPHAKGYGPQEAAPCQESCRGVHFPPEDWTTSEG